MTDDERREHEETIERYRMAVASPTPISFAALGAMDDAAHASRKALEAAALVRREATGRDGE